ncbi:hypothetical protein [Quatrionicoccus australiensis]|uniref:hypothetical protein n=1 Tax=Quatrionicoccus australiensis TaxID=138118 RepID=UPI001CFA1AF0|nr:hypothetical protein [Quatrionicoccus australiensis]MCB4359512.1 hypothetical protein [Quatrionicoccus australiensis]
MLAPGNHPQDMQFLLGEWYTGSSDSEIAYIPAICSMIQGDDERHKKSSPQKATQQTATSAAANGAITCKATSTPTLT